MLVRRVRAQLHRLDELVGYRGSVLLFLALWSGGQVQRFAWPDHTTVTSPTNIYLATIAPLHVLAVPWAISAGLCIVQAFSRTDWPAFAFAAGVLVAWAVMYLVGGIQGAIPQGAWACIVQVAVAGLILRISRWTEPPRRE